MTTLTKSIWIEAPPEVVFQYFVEAEKKARWCGGGAELDPVPQGLYQVDMGDCGLIKGRFIRIEAPVFVSWEVDAPMGTDLPPSLIEVSISAEADGSRVEISQSGLEAPTNTIASRGWDHHLARLAVAATGGAPGSDPFCKRDMQSLI